MPIHIYIVDDEPDILELVTVHLEQNGFVAKGFLNSREFYQAIEKSKPDLLILDLMLPDEDGLEICKNVKQKDGMSHIPIIILSAKGEESDKVVGLELGADDYVTKPFSPRELIARVKAVLRRQGEKTESKRLFMGDDVTIDLKRYEVTIGDEKVNLTPTEFKLLSLMSAKKGMVFSREQILDYLWGSEKAVIDRTVDMHVKNLRKKLGDSARYIKNVRGIGYKIEE